MPGKAVAESTPRHPHYVSAYCPVHSLQEGCFRAMWAVTSSSAPEFGEVRACAEKCKSMQVAQLAQVLVAEAGINHVNLLERMDSVPVPRERLPLHGCFG